MTHALIANSGEFCKTPQPLDAHPAAGVHSLVGDTFDHACIVSLIKRIVSHLPTQGKHCFASEPAWCSATRRIAATPAGYQTEFWRDC